MERSVVSFKERSVVKTADETTINTTLLVKQDHKVVVKISLCETQNIETPDDSMLTVKCSGVISENGEIKYPDDENNNNVYCSEETFPIIRLKDEPAYSLSNTAFLMANEVGLFIQSGMNIKDLSLKDLFLTNSSVRQMQSFHRRTIRYGNETGDYARLNNRKCIDKERGVYEYVATNCNGPLASHLQLQVLFVPINNKHHCSDSCLYLLFIDVDTGGTNINMCGEFNVSEYLKMFEGFNKSAVRFKGNVIRDEELMKLILNEYMTLVANDLDAANIDTMEKLIKHNVLQFPEFYFKTAIENVAKDCNS